VVFSVCHIVLTVAVCGGPALAGDLTPPPGAPGPTMKTLEEVEPRIPVQSLSGDADALYVIDQPGSYYLADNVTGVSGKHGIEVTTGNVVLDLGGYTLSGVPGSLDGVNVSGDQNITVHNGLLRDWGSRGVYVTAGSGSQSPRLTGLQVTSCGSDGIWVTHAVVTDCTGATNGGAGIHADRSVLDNCIAVGNTDVGFDLAYSTATGCRASENGDGIHASYGSQVRHCLASGNTGQGIEANSGSAVTDCVVSYNEAGGIVVLSGATGCRVLNNTCNGNQNIIAGLGNGIAVYGSKNIVDGNTCMDNYECGIWVHQNASANLIVRNQASGNPTSNYAGLSGQKAGTVTGDPTTAGPCDNFDLDL
jgi:parallel beta-helix repeat protein